MLNILMIIFMIIRIMIMRTTITIIMITSTITAITITLLFPDHLTKEIPCEHRFWDIFQTGFMSYVWERISAKD